MEFIWDGIEKDFDFQPIFMLSERITRGDYMEIFEEWIETLDFLEGELEETIKELANKYKTNVSFLYSINQCLVNKTGALEDKRKGTRYEYQEEESILAFGTKSLRLPHKQMKQVIAGMIDIFEDILPLGTVVDLKKDYFAKVMPDIEKVDNFRVVITYRFLHYEGGNVYFPYAGLIYPVGATIPPTMIHFTPMTIEKVVHMGFSDEFEQAFVMKEKIEHIVENKMHSVTFSDEEEISQLSEKIKGSE